MITFFAAANIEYTLIKQLCRQFVGTIMLYYHCNLNKGPQK